MGFIAKNFSFDRIPCSEFGLRIYDVAGEENTSTPFSLGEPITDVIPSTGHTFLYGRNYEDPLEFKLVFGLDPKRYLNMNEYLDRYEIDAITNWLTGHDTYKWLEIEQPDLEISRFKCIITDLEPIQLSWLPWAFTAKISCDSPYGYMYPRKFNYVCTGSTEITLVSKSTLNQFYYPKLDITLNGSNSISLVNKSCNNTELRFDNLPKNYSLTISVDNKLGKIKSSDASYSNMYKYCNFTWLPLKKGVNKILVTGRCILDFTCEFPVNYGG